jgi:uncharacterized protein YjbI with pentapeptide repeats/beta-lactamase regulating signal transducer with metallopeptidase domain
MVEAVVGVALRAILASVLLGGVLAALVLVATKTLSLTAATRHALWTTALIATALMPLAGVGTSIARTTAAAAPAATSTAHVVSGDASEALLSRFETFAVIGNTGTPKVTTAQPAPSFAERLRIADRLAFAAWTPRVSRVIALSVAAIWALGALIGLIGLAASVARVRGLKRRSSPLDGTLADELPWLTEIGPGREIYLRLSYETETPVAIGFRRPVILIPTELATADGLAAIESLILHEHAHLRRNDDWTNLLQRTIERVFWFNPIVWFVGRRIALEREIASDDAVVEKTGEAHAYATSLWKLVREMRMPEHAVVAPGALLTRKQITVRIEQLLDKKRARLHRSPAAALGVAFAGVLSVAFVATSAPAVELPAASANVATAATTPSHAHARHRPTTAVRSTAPAKHVWAAAPSTAARLARNTVPAHKTGSIDAPTKAMQAQLKLLRAQLAAAKARSATVHQKMIRIVERGPDAALPAPPAAALRDVPAPAAPPAAVPPLAPLPVIAVPAPAPARVRYDVDIERTINAAMAQIPREIEAGVSSGAARHSRFFDGMKLTREMVASCVACSFRNADARGLDLHDLKLNADNFSGADMRGANLNGAKLAGVSLASANLTNADLRGAILTAVELRGANFEGAQLEGVHLMGVSVRRLNLHGTSLRSVVANCIGCDFGGLDLHGQDLHGLTLTGADFNHTDLHDANLSGVHFFKVDLSHANLSGADLTNAHLETCNLDSTDLRGARTSGMTTHTSGQDG